MLLLSLLADLNVAFLLAGYVIFGFVPHVRMLFAAILFNSLHLPLALS